MKINLKNTFISGISSAIIGISFLISVPASANAEQQTAQEILPIKYQVGELVLANQFDKNKVEQALKSAGINDVQIEEIEEVGMVVKSNRLKERSNRTKSKRNVKLKDKFHQVDSETVNLIQVLKNHGLEAYPNTIAEPFADLNDTFYSSQWHLRNTGQTSPGVRRLESGAYQLRTVVGTPGVDMKVSEAFDITTGNSNIRIAVIDNGFDLTHPDLVPNLLPGYDAGDLDNDPSFNNISNQSHGTAVAGVAAARGNNNLGVSGTCPQCSILPIKASIGTASGFTDDALARAVRYAIQNNATVINMSLGSTSYPPLVDEAIKDALAANIVVVAATGNDGEQRVNYPAALGGVISVTATDANDVISDFSTIGSWVDVAAPGEGVLTTHTRGFNRDAAHGDNTFSSPNDGYGYARGTSFAAPAVSGVVGLMKSRNPHLTPAQVKGIIKNSTENINSLNPSKLGQFGTGRVDARKALENTFTIVDNIPDFLWQNENTGLIAGWYMNSAGSYTGAAFSYQTNPGPFWKVVTTSDFNNDGIRDLVFRAQDGTPATWIMNSQNQIVRASALPTLPFEWRLVEVVDLNRDNIPDFLWQNENTGLIAGWYMNNTGNYSGTAFAYPTNPGPFWKVVSTSDFNNDGIRDLVLRGQDGTPSTWIMNAQNQIVSANTLPTAPMEWRLIEVVDLNRDNTPDFLWQNNTSGQVAGWYMNNTGNYSGTAFAYQTNPGPLWKVVSTSDFNNDGIRDLVFRAQDGTPGTWVMNAQNQIMRASALPTAPFEWRLIGVYRL